MNVGSEIFLLVSDRLFIMGLPRLLAISSTSLVLPYSVIIPFYSKLLITYSTLRVEWFLFSLECEPEGKGGGVKGRPGMIFQTSAFDHFFSKRRYDAALVPFRWYLILPEDRFDGGAVPFFAIGASRWTNGCGFWCTAPRRDFARFSYALFFTFPMTCHCLYCANCDQIQTFQFEND